MIELKNDELVFSFPEVHKDAVLRVGFQRTLRIPDDGKTHYLPPGLGHFPLKHVDDYTYHVPQSWSLHGGVMMPMFQSEAMWLSFSSPNDYPFAVKVAAGKINAVTGDGWMNGLNRDPQDYMQIPRQPWLDGFCVEKGIIRQFVAMPLGDGYTAEEQITGRSEFGGLQIIAYPVKKTVYEKSNHRKYRKEAVPCPNCVCESAVEMGLAPGGKMTQDIYEDEYRMDDWDQRSFSRCFVHLANSAQWHHITGQAPPQEVPTAELYTSSGLPWFDYYSDAPAMEGSGSLQKLKSVKQMGDDKGENPLPENVSITMTIPAIWCPSLKCFLTESKSPPPGSCMKGRNRKIFLPATPCRATKP